MEIFVLQNPVPFEHQMQEVDKMIHVFVFIYVLIDGFGHKFAALDELDSIYCNVYKIDDVFVFLVFSFFVVDYMTQDDLWGIFAKYGTFEDFWHGMLRGLDKARQVIS